MYEKMKVRLIGIVPMLTHNARLGDENSSYTTRLKQLIMEKKQAKNNITDKLLKSITQTEFEGGAYFDNEGKIMIPSDVMEGMLANAGAKNAGTTKSQIVISVMVPEHFYFTKVDGPLDIKKRFEEGFYDQRVVALQKAKILRTRQKITNWVAEGEIHYDTELIDAEKIPDLLAAGGQKCGIGDYRPKFGRFEFEIL